MLFYFKNSIVFSNLQGFFVCVCVFFFNGYRTTLKGWLNSLDSWIHAEGIHASQVQLDLT